MRIIGIDPGLRRTGWGIIQFDGNKLKHIANGTCKSSASNELAVRLLEIYQQLVSVINFHSPKFAAVENTFVSKDAAGTLKLGQARGIALLAPAQAGLPVFEYAPNTVKKAVVGVGHADKVQVEHMVKMQLPGVIIAGPDAADALGIALCHAYQGKYNERVLNALARAKVT
jgi:crossover junction endodeoxyribonuclease RuvC